MTVNGQPYWIGTQLNNISRRRVFGLTFDVHREEFRVLPELVFACFRDTRWRVVNLKDALTVMVCVAGTCGTVVHIYSLDETSTASRFGVWNEIHCVGPIVNCCVKDLLHCFKYGVIALIDKEDKLVLYDPESRRTKKSVGSLEDSECVTGFSHMESLVSIEGMKPLNA